MALLHSWYEHYVCQPSTQNPVASPHYSTLKKPSSLPSTATIIVRIKWSHKMETEATQTCDTMARIRRLQLSALHRIFAEAAVLPLSLRSIQRQPSITAEASSELLPHVATVHGLCSLRSAT